MCNQSNYRNVKQWREANRDKYNSSMRRYRAWLKIRGEYMSAFSPDCFR